MTIGLDTVPKPLMQNSASNYDPICALISLLVMSAVAHGSSHPRTAQRVYSRSNLHIILCCSACHACLHHRHNHPFHGMPSCDEDVAIMVRSSACAHDLGSWPARAGHDPRSSEPGPCPLSRVGYVTWLAAFHSMIFRALHVTHNQGCAGV